MTDNAPSSTSPTRFQLVVATVLLGLFVLFLVVLFVMRSDQQWDRMIFLFNGFEAVVFAGAGMLFGTSVQRANLQSAQADASTQRDRAEQAEQAANAGRQLKAAVEHRADLRHAAAAALPSARLGAPSQDAGGPAPMTPTADLMELAAMARALFPDR
jgi:hypothetical protein